MTTNELYDVRRRDVLKTIGLGVGLGAMGTAWMSGTAAASSDVLLWGVEQQTGKLIEVDATDGTKSEILDLQILASNSGITLSFSSSTPNGNAYDVEENRFYFTSFQAEGLYFVDLDDSPRSITPAGQLNAAAASGTITIDDDGKAFYYVENGTDNLKRVSLDPDGTIGTEVSAGNISPYGGSFGDIAFSPDGLLYISSGGADLATYNVDTGDKNEFTGLSPSDKFQISFAGDSTLYLHQTGTGKFFYFDENTQALVEPQWSKDGDGTPTLTDLTGNKPLTCEECTSTELLAKYEFACVDEDPDTGECLAYDFMFEKGDENLVSYVDFGADEDGEPISATFSTEYCEVWAVVKAGQELDVQQLTPVSGEITANYVDPYAISFVAFFCTEAAAEAFAGGFPSNGKGKPE